MSYNEACDAEVTRAEAQLEIRRHHCEWSDFVAECGERETYQGVDVLAWLGY